MKIDIEKLSPAMRQYMAIKQEYADYLVFYRLGDFYELFFDDARTASQVLDLTLTKRGKYEDEDIPMCGVPYHAYESYLARLIKSGYKVAICEQMESPEDAKKRGYKSVVKRDVVRLVTSGTLTEDVLLDARCNNYLLAIADFNGSYAMSWLDLSTGIFYTEELKTKNGALEIFNALSRISPGEILFAETMLNNPEIFELLQQYKEKLSPLPKARFNFANAQKRLLTYFNVNTLDVFGNFSKAEVIAAGIILDYVEITQKASAPRIREPQKIIGSQYMEIDASTRSNLDLFDAPRGNSLIATVDRTITGSGARMLKSWLMAPLLDKDKINARLDAIEFMMSHHAVRQKLREILREYPDVERSISRLSLGRKDGPQDLHAVLKMLLLLPKIKVLIESYQPTDVVDEMPESLRKALADFGHHGNLADKLGRALADVEVFPQFARDGGFIAAGFSPELDAVRQMKNDGHQFIVNLQGKYAEKTQIEHLKIKYNNVVGYFIEVPSKNAKTLLENPEFIHRQSVLNATRFTTIELTELENQLRGSAEKALAMELEIYERLVKDVLVSADDISLASAAVSFIDVVAAQADLALENNYCRPSLDNSLVFDVKGGRHPIVENALKKANDAAFVSNDCYLDVENNRIWLITGPNMAGKSTFLRQNAIIAVMAQAGCYVPATSAHIGIVNKLFSRVGASDDLARGRSTFMVEMVETSTILNNADEHSLVILDEIGRGTATFDGLSIAWSTVEYLYEANRCRALFATHYHELTALTSRLPLLTLHCMKIKEFKDQVIFLHEIIDGAADRSYGIHVAKLAGIPKAVVLRAQEVLNRLETDGQKKNMGSIATDLPLFAFAESDEQEQPSALEKALREIDPDNLTAREALDKLYELKTLIKDK